MIVLGNCNVVLDDISGYNITLLPNKTLCDGCFVPKDGFNLVRYRVEGGDNYNASGVNLALLTITLYGVIKFWTKNLRYFFF
jgi:hypothetical protein